MCDVDPKLPACFPELIGPGDKGAMEGASAESKTCTQQLLEQLLLRGHSAGVSTPLPAFPKPPLPCKQWACYAPT